MRETQQRIRSKYSQAPRVFQRASVVDSSIHVIHMGKYGRSGTYLANNPKGCKRILIINRFLFCVTRGCKLKKIWETRPPPSGPNSHYQPVVSRPSHRRHHYHHYHHYHQHHRQHHRQHRRHRDCSPPSTGAPHRAPYCAISASCQPRPQPRPHLPRLKPCPRTDPHHAPHSASASTRWRVARRPWSGG
jgi:hypothetical protein